MTIVLENLFPIFALMAAGKLMRHWNFTTEAFLRVSDRLVYFIFFPAMLFWKIGSAPPDLSGESAFYAAVTLAVAAVYLLSTTFIIVGKVGTYQAGSFSQSCYRINTFIGVAVMMSTLGEEGVRRFGILIGIFVPLIHVLSVSTLIWFGGKRVALRTQISQTARALATNPLVLACVGGMIYGQLVNRFPGFIDNTLRLASYVTLPLALLSVGSMLTLESLRTHFRLALAASLFKLLVLPAIGFMCLGALGADGPSFRIGMIFFSLPTSSATYILSSQLNSDPELASAAIALSTLLSFFSLSAALLM
jgi:predicted permease